MLNIDELKQFVSFAELGTLSKVSESFHISTPTITRTMQHMEEVFGVPLFSRSKNRIELNETGLKAVAYSKNVLDELDNAITKTNEFDKSLKTITVESCAPAPLWQLLPSLSTAFPKMTISSSICDIDKIIDDLDHQKCTIGILPYDIPNASFQMKPFMHEKLFVSVKKDHELAAKKKLRFADINGFNFLLRSEIGFWDSMCRSNMPSSKFLVQSDEFEFIELANASSLPCFATDYPLKRNPFSHERVLIPITDDDADVTFYLASHDIKKYATGLI